MNYLLRALATTGAFLFFRVGRWRGRDGGLRARGGRRRGLGFTGLAGEEFPITLFVLIPFVTLPEDGNEGHDQNKGNTEEPGIEIATAGLHIRPVLAT